MKAEGTASSSTGSCSFCIGRSSKLSESLVVFMLGKCCWCWCIVRKLWLAFLPFYFKCGMMLVVNAARHFFCSCNTEAVTLFIDQSTVTISAVFLGSNFKKSLSGVYKLSENHYWRNRIVRKTAQPIKF